MESTTNELVSLSSSSSSRQEGEVDLTQPVASVEAKGYDEELAVPTTPLPINWDYLDNLRPRSRPASPAPSLDFYEGRNAPTPEPMSQWDVAVETEVEVGRQEQPEQEVEEEEEEADQDQEVHHQPSASPAPPPAPPSNTPNPYFLADNFAAASPSSSEEEETIHITLTAANFRPIHVDVTDTHSILDLARLFRKKNRLRATVGIQISYKGRLLHDWEVRVGQLGMVQGERLRFRVSWVGAVFTG